MKYFVPQVYEPKSVVVLRDTRDTNGIVGRPERDDEEGLVRIKNSLGPNRY